MTNRTWPRTAVPDQKSKEAYFTASQSQLIWARFKRNRMAMTAGSVLVFLILIGLFAPFLSPYNPTIAGRDPDYQNGAPQIPRFCDDKGCSLAPFIYGTKRERSIKTNFRWVTTVDTEDRRHLQLFVQGWEYSLLGIDLPGLDRPEVQDTSVRGRQGRDTSVRHRCVRQGHLLANPARHQHIPCGGHIGGLYQLRSGADHRRCVRLFRRLA